MSPLSTPCHLLGIMISTGGYQPYFPDGGELEVINRPTQEKVPLRDVTIANLFF